MLNHRWIYLRKEYQYILSGKPKTTIQYTPAHLVNEQGKALCNMNRDLEGGPTFTVTQVEGFSKKGYCKLCLQKEKRIINESNAKR